MKKFAFLLMFLFAFAQISVAYGGSIADSQPLLTYYLFPGAVQAVNSSTIAIIANGFRSEISLYGLCQAEKEQDDQKAKQLLEKLIDGKRTEVKIYGKDANLRSTAIVIADNVNINNELLKQGYLKNGNQCNSAIIFDYENLIAKEKDDYKYELLDYCGSKTVHVKEYTKKDGTRVRSHYRSSPCKIPVKFNTSDEYQKKDTSSLYKYSPSGSGRPKTVHVKEYTRKDGTRVRSHHRSPPRR